MSRLEFSSVVVVVVELIVESSEEACTTMMMTRENSLKDNSYTNRYRYPLP